MSTTRPATTEPYVTAAQVGEFLVVSARTITRMVGRGILPCYRPLGPVGPVRFRLSDVEKAMRRAMQTGRKTDRRIPSPQVALTNQQQDSDL